MHGVDVLLRLLLNLLVISIALSVSSFTATLQSMRAIINASTCRMKRGSLVTSTSSTYSDSDVAASVALGAREDIPSSSNVAPETDHRVAGHVAWSKQTHANSFMSAGSIPPLRASKVHRQLEVLEYLRSSLFGRGFWVIAVLGDIVGGKEQTRPRHGDDPYQSFHCFPARGIMRISKTAASD